MENHQLPDTKVKTAQKKFSWIHTQTYMFGDGWVLPGGSEFWLALITFPGSP
jgi:hypothetical protein